MEENEVKINKIECEGSKVTLSTRSGRVYVLEEQPLKVINDSKKASTMTRKDRSGNVVDEVNESLFMTKLIVKSCTNPILREAEFDIESLPGSEGLMLQKAIADLYDLESFLK